MAATTRKYTAEDATWAADPAAAGTRKEIGPVIDRGTKRRERPTP